MVDVVTALSRGVMARERGDQKHRVSRQHVIRAELERGEGSRCEHVRGVVMTDGVLCMPYGVDDGERLHADTFGYASIGP